jgi:hypothetical protein
LGSSGFDPSEEAEQFEQHTKKVVYDGIIKYYQEVLGKDLPMETEPESSDFTLVAGQLTFLLSIESENNTDFIEKFQNLDDEPRNELTKLA